MSNYINDAYHNKSHYYPSSATVIPFQQCKNNSPMRVNVKNNHNPISNLYTSNDFFETILKKNISHNPNSHSYSPTQSKYYRQQSHNSQNLIKLTDSNFYSQQIFNNQSLSKQPQKSDSFSKKQHSIVLDSPSKKAQNNIFNNNQINGFAKNQLIKRSPSDTKLDKRPSFYNQGKVSLNKFKIFYKTIFYGIKNENDLNELWQQFENSVNNPFQFDKFIEKISNQKRVQQQEKCIDRILETFAEQKKYKLQNVSNKRVGNRFHSIGKKIKQLISQKKRKRMQVGKSLRSKEVHSKGIILKNISNISKLLSQGQKKIKKR